MDVSDFQKDDQPIVSQMIQDSDIRKIAPKMDKLKESKRIDFLKYQGRILLKDEIERKKIQSEIEKLEIRQAILSKEKDLRFKGEIHS